MYNKVYKNYQISLGVPFQVNQSLNFKTIKRVDIGNEEDSEIYITPQEESKIREQILQSARDEADLIIKEANYEAERIINEIQNEAIENANAIIQEARQKGFEEGYNEVKKQYEDLLVEAESIKEHARVEYKEVLESIESDAVNIVLDITRKVLGMEISTNKEVILSLIKQAFEKCSSKENVVLKVSNEDYEYVCANKDVIMGQVEGIGELDIKKDSSLKAGGCIVETPYGTIDAGMETKFKKIENAFRDVIFNEK
ncbi:MAG TPA: FliH/SctL family protein [Pseudobacteroides sp.]|nr:FliH/SctL family protein [Pseudobacteroides sp.]